MEHAGLNAANVTGGMTAPMFSIIVPTLNAAATLPTCLDSVICQSCSDFELVLVDGGSTDGTVDIANGCNPQLGTRLVMHSGPDQGVYDAMNLGVGMATGAWLLFLGADDALHEPDTLARVAAFIGEHEPSDLVYGDVIIRSTWSRWGGAFDLDRLQFETNICHQAIFYRKELFAGIGPYNLCYPVWADWDFNIRCFSNPALVTRYMDIVVADYNDMTGVCASKGADKEFRKRLPVYFWWSALETCRRQLALLRRKEAWRLAPLALRQQLIRNRAARNARSRSSTH
jgi:glycosyltransferase involved in cell wall biosynthesis